MNGWASGSPISAWVERTIHLRGIHYALLGMPLPNGETYESTDKQWLWLVDNAAKAARWLGYVRFD